MDKIKEFMTIAEEKTGILLAKRLFCVLLLLFEVDRTIIVQNLGGSRTTVKKYGALLESRNIRIYLRTRSTAAEARWKIFGNQ
jgi:hypothetical protein